LDNQTFTLGDRVVYVSDTGIVPLGFKGTIVALSEKIIDVLFDKPFLGGTTLNGRYIKKKEKKSNRHLK
jgi:5'-3' exoribonuclease 1